MKQKESKREKEISCVKGYKFPKCLRIRKKTEYQLIYNNGKRFNTKNFILFLLKNNLQYPRIGITVTRKYGKAYKRNRIKRLLREFFRLNRELFRKGYDFVIIVKKEASVRKLDDIKDELRNFLKNEEIYNF